MKRRYVLKNKTRFFSAVTITITLITTLIFAASTYGQVEQNYEVFRVAKGDTLWGIAVKHNTAGDIRKYIYDLKKLNNLKSCEIKEGSELKIPKSGVLHSTQQVNVCR
jgi:LysM repeat protein